MSIELDFTEEELQAVYARVERHRTDYIQSGGTKGHIFSFDGYGGRAFTTTLLLRTIGRKTGQARVLPLIYGNVAGEVVVIASKGGGPDHPAWYLNMRDGSDVAFQIATQAFRASWREPDEAERAKVWAYMEELFPPYASYQAGTDRQIPVVMMTPLEPTNVFSE
jgi:deazaflavin-dependent oxidoreductase (nitroreductase family)